MKRGMRVATGKQTVDRSDERRLLKESVATFVARTSGVSRARVLRDRASSYDASMWHEMANLGWLAVTLPEEHGGLGLSLTELAVIVEELGGALAPEPIIEAVTLAGGLLFHVGGAVADSLLPRIAAGEVIASLAWQESSGSYDPEAVTTVVVANPGGGNWLNGIKTFVPSADVANGFIVTARNERGLALYWVPAESKGLDISLQLLADGSRLGRVTFNQVAVKDDQRVAAGNNVARALSLALDEATVMASVSLVGLMSKALEMTIEYMKMRVQFGKPIGSFQALQHRTVDLYIQQELAKAAVDDALTALEGDTDPANRLRAVSRAKARCSDAALEICREAIQLHGAIAYTDEYDLGLYLNRALVLAAWLGNSTYHRHRYAMIGKKAIRGALS